MAFTPMIMSYKGYYLIATQLSELRSKVLILGLPFS